MKFIIDFDDVLLHTTKMLKKRIYDCLENAGVEREKALDLYRRVRYPEFSLRKFIYRLLEENNLDINKTEEIYEDIMKETPKYINHHLVEEVKKLGKESCIVVTNGEKEFQTHKLKRSGLYDLFSEIYIVPGSKKDIIFEICKKYKDEKIVFTDDKATFFDDLELKSLPNLETVLYLP